VGRRTPLVAGAAVPALVAAAVVVAHDSRRRVVARGVVEHRPWTLTAWRGTEPCPELSYDGTVTRGGCGFGGAEPDATGSAGGHAVVFGPAPHDARVVLVEGAPLPVVSGTRPLTWLPRRRVFVAALPDGFAYTGVRFAP
jgi:hypothetical protein